MQAAVYKAESKDSQYLELSEVSKPELGANNAIAKVRGVGVCGSDLLKLDRALVQEGTVLGHELVGEISEISEEMSAKYNLKIGDRIISSHHVPCLKCDYCLNDQESLCTQFKSTNFNPGAFCEYLELSEGHLKHTVMKIPDDLSDEEASFTEPIACCIKAIKKSGLLTYKSQQKGEEICSSSKHLSSKFTTINEDSDNAKIGQRSKPFKVIVYGLGSIGQIVGQLVKHYRPDAEVLGCDLLEYRLNMSKKHGFDQAEFELENQNADYIFLCAGAEITTKLAASNIKTGGTIIVFSSTATDSFFNNNEIYYKELTVLGSYSPNLEDLRESLELLSTKKIQVKQLITHRAELKNLGKTIKTCKEDRGIKTYLQVG